MRVLVLRRRHHRRPLVWVRPLVVVSFNLERTDSRIYHHQLLLQAELIEERAVGRSLELEVSQAPRTLLRRIWVAGVPRITHPRSHVLTRPESERRAAATATCATTKLVTVYGLCSYARNARVYKDTERRKCKSAGKVIEDDEAESPGRVSAGADDGRIIPGLAAAVVQSHSHRCQLWMTGRGLS